MAIRLGADFLATGHVTGMLLLASEALWSCLTMVRRSAGVVDRSDAGAGADGVLDVRPAAGAARRPSPRSRRSRDRRDLRDRAVIVIAGKLSLGRSFGLIPANRGVVSTGVYRFVRHPIYLGYLITHVGFVVANPTMWNVVC